MFNLQLDDFPVDTHVSMTQSFFHSTWLHWINTNAWIIIQVFEIAKTIGWVPAVADRNKTYLHLNQRIPNDLKFDLNCLLYTHGKLCRKCTSKKGNQQREKCNDSPCPLLNYCKEPVWSLKFDFCKQSCSQSFDFQNFYGPYSPSDILTLYNTSVIDLGRRIFLKS